MPQRLKVLFLRSLQTICQSKNPPQWLRFLINGFPLVRRAQSSNGIMTAVVGSTSEIVPKNVTHNGKGSQEKRSSVSKVTKHGEIFQKETRDVRPVPGSSSFVRADLIDIAQVKKLPSGDYYLTLYMDNLSYRANDVTLKTTIEKRLPITVDQAVVAYSSDGRSRGCGFVTVR
jgi:hypothetical protein